MIPSVSVHGASIPALGFGTWELRGDVARSAVASALDAGYRHIDTAAMYGNEREIGDAVAAHGTPRDDIFVTTKVWPGNVAEGAFQQSVERSVEFLRVGPVDLVLIHWPADGMPIAEQIGLLCDVKKRGLTRHVGVSNFSAEQLSEAVAAADEPLVTNQIPYHPWIDQAALLAACRAHGMAVTAYSPIGKASRLDAPVLQDLARKHGRTPAQIVLRWHVQQPLVIAIPRSSRPDRIASNARIFDFELDAAEMEAIAALAG